MIHTIITCVRFVRVLPLENGLVWDPHEKTQVFNSGSYFLSLNEYAKSIYLKLYLTLV